MPAARGIPAMLFVKVATTAEVPPGEGKQVEAGGRKLALFNVGGRFSAVRDFCPHRGASLWDGSLVGNCVVCPWHGARFDLTTGANVGPPASAPLDCYKVEV